MYFNILRRDLKRKKTMNVILLLFAILASMFVSSGISNVVTVMNGTDHYLDMAGVGDYVVITQNEFSNVEDILKESGSVTSYKKENCYWGSKDDLEANGKKINLKNNTILFHKIFSNGINYFDTNNEKITKVNDGELYVTAGFLEANDLSVGDIIKIKYHDIDKEYKIAGEMKDALLGSDMMGNTRLLISENDYDAYENVDNAELAFYRGSIFYVTVDDANDLSSEISEAEGVLFSGNRSLIRLTYVMEMIVAMIVLVLSVCLCIVSFVLLKFVITFTINEEYREIGVMKAIGIRNFKIRSIYMTKYFAMAVVGGILGFVLGIPFGRVLINSVSKKMVLSNDFGYGLNILGAILVIAIMSGFAYLCTNKVKKSTPVDAIRNGATGERYSKKAKFAIGKSKFTNAFSLALNDVLSAPKRFLTIILSFFLCSVFVFGLVEVTDTMKSDRLITTFGKKSDVYINADKFIGMSLMAKGGDEKLKDELIEIEEEIDNLGIPGKASCEVWYKYKAIVDDKTYLVCCQQNKYTHTTDYEYTEGSAPQNDGEVAITKQISEQLGTQIGDVITIDFVTEKKDCIVVGYFQTMNQLGSIIRLHEDANTSMEYANAIMGVQIDFDDAPNEQEIENRIDTLVDYYDISDDEIFNATQYCDNCMGVADTMDMVSKLLLVITCVVVAMVTVLMERSFISDETSQIALLKAIGFNDRFIIKWQIYRLMLVAIAAELFAIILTYPVTKLWCDPIWKMMGATNVEYYFKPLSLLVIYPGIILIITLLSVWITAGFTRTITCNDVGNVE